MRSTIYTLAAAAALLQPISASLIPHLLRSFEDLQDLRKRCEGTVCGYYGQACCDSTEQCITNSNNEAECVPATGGGSGNSGEGSWIYTTMTYVMTDLETITTTLSSFVPATTGSCAYSEGETKCGSNCCQSGEFCENPDTGTCKDTGSGSSGYYSGQVTVTTVLTNTADQPYRPTSNTLVTVTATGTLGEITTTQGFLSPTGGSIIAEPQDGGGGGLSGGAIAGIVIGVLAAIIILILICLCCCAKGILDTILGIFGLGPRRRRREEEVEVYESRHHHGSRHGSVAAGRRTWFGTKPKRSSVVEEKKSGWGRGASVAAFLGGLALILGLKRRRDRKDDKSSVGYGSSYYSDYTSSKLPSSY
jgi:hypothetical protein